MLRRGSYVSFIESKVSDNHGDHKPAVCLSNREGGDLPGCVELTAPFVLETEVSPKTDAPEFCWELLTVGYCCDDLDFGRAAFSQPLFSVRMQGDFHILILLCDADVHRLSEKAQRFRIPAQSIFSRSRKQMVALR